MNPIIIMIRTPITPLKNFVIRLSTPARVARVSKPTFSTKVLAALPAFSTNMLPAAAAVSTKAFPATAAFSMKVLPATAAFSTTVIPTSPNFPMSVVPTPEALSKTSMDTTILGAVVVVAMSARRVRFSSWMIPSS